MLWRNGSDLISVTVPWLVVCLLLAGCAGQDGAAENHTAASRPDTATAAAAAQVPAPERHSADLAGYPMPSELSGAERLPGVITHTSADRTLGNAGTLVFGAAGDTLLVTACGVSLNCCTERLAASLTGTATSTDVMLYEYLPDVCECQHDRDIRLRICPRPAAGRLLVVRANDRDRVLARGEVP